jgi:hypothetical protein
MPFTEYRAYVGLLKEAVASYFGCVTTIICRTLTAQGYYFGGCGVILTFTVDLSRYKLKFFKMLFGYCCKIMKQGFLGKFENMLSARYSGPVF